MRHFIFGRTRSIHIQFLRYFFVGGSAAIVDLLVFAVLVEYLDIHYLLAALIAYMFGLAWNHIICLLWVFQSKHGRLKEVVMVVLIAFGGLFWTELILFGLVDLGGMQEIIAKMISQVIVLVWNFGMRKIYVFH